MNPTPDPSHLPTSKSLPSRRRPNEVLAFPKRWHTFPPTTMDLPIQSPEHIPESVESSKPMPRVPTNSPASGGLPEASSWNTDANYSPPSGGSPDDCAVEDEEIKSPVTSNPLFHSRSMPQLPRPLSILSIKIAGWKEWKRGGTNDPYQSDQDEWARSISAPSFIVVGGDGDDDPGLEMKIHTKTKNKNEINNKNVNEDLKSEKVKQDIFELTLEAEGKWW
ncbi:hypothetical protein GGR51DRAFT_556204 [Nemania sp. FL0031]|nr:hypothetical protein GGR51DRAFT_556204 [Nemania sp. FL0031]